MCDKTIQEQCRKHQEDCYKTNIKPIMNEIKELKTDLKDFGKEFRDFKAELKEIVAVIPYQVFEKTMEEADKKYAAKLTQRIVYGLVVIVLTSFVGGVVALVMK